MKIKKITSLLLVLTFLIAELSFLSFGGISIAASPNKDLSLDTYSKDYYGRQLNEQAWKFYNAMVDMYNNDTFKKGQDYNLIAKGVVEEADLLKYATGTTQLLYDMTAARDAFQYDYPEVFWVDWSAISLRVTRDSNGNYFAFLGRGKRDDYFLPGFNAENIDSKINEYNQLMEQAISEIRAQTQHEDNKDSQDYELAKAAHNWEMNKMSYKFEYEVKDYNTDKPYSNARTAYDCLKFGEGVCESYTRAYKALLDNLGINCIVAGGGYKVSDTQTENHAWNYVQIGGKWYGVDVTHDDDDNSDKQSRKYFMVGTAELFDRRIESGIFSQSMFEFKYPTLETSSLQEIEEEYDDGKFSVTVITSDYVEEGDHAGDDAGHVLKDTFRLFVSYDGKDYTNNAENGKYMLARFATFDEDTNTWAYTPWGYITPKLYPALEEKTSEKYGNYIDFKLPQVELVQFAVADKGPKIDASTGAPYLDELYYKGDASLLEERTKTFINNTGNIYQAPPYIKKATPPQNVKLGFESTYKVKIEYDDYFETTDGTSTGNIAITDVYKPNKTKRNDLIASSKISNVEYHLGNASENAWVEFDFTPSAQFSANEVAYDITWQGVVGHKSKKAPMPANYAVGNKCDFCALSGQGIDCNVFAQPELMDTANLSANGWKTKGENGEEVDLPQELAGANLDQLSHRLTLSTTTIADDESLDMVNGLDELKNKSAKTESYNIRMQLCKKQVVNTGNSVRIRLGFPEGTTYEDYISGRREFKVYHYFYDELGTITGHEEIPVEVVPQGLILYVDSFSPFTIAGIEVPQEEQEAKAAAAKAKILMLASTEGGYLSCDAAEKDKQDMIKMDNKEEVTIKIHPNENRTIESIAVGTKVIPLISENIKRNDDGTFSFNVKREELSDGTTMVYAKLMSTLIVEEDIREDHGYQVEQPEADKYVDTTDSDGNGYCDIHPSTATTIEALIAEKSVPGVKVEVIDANGNAITDTSKLIGTGMKIRISNDTNSSHIYTETEIVVSGDMTGDGLMNANDIKNWRIGILSESLEGAFKMAADYNRDGKQDATDMRSMRTDIISTL